MVGRKPKSYDMGQWIRVDLPIFQVIATDPIKGTWLQKIYEDDFPIVKEHLLKEGYTQISADQVDWTYVPRACPKCNVRGGHPNFRLYNRAKSWRDENFRQETSRRFKVHYNHSKPKYHQCFIGYFQNYVWKLASGIDHERMYRMNNNRDKQERFKLPKFRKPRKLV